MCPEDSLAGSSNVQGEGEGVAGEPSRLLPLPALRTCLGKGGMQLLDILYPCSVCV